MRTGELAAARRRETGGRRYRSGKPLIDRRKPGAAPVTMHIQVAEWPRWIKTAHELPAFDRFPPIGMTGDDARRSIA